MKNKFAFLEIFYIVFNSQFRFVLSETEMKELVQVRYKCALECDYSSVYQYLKFRENLNEAEIAEMCEEYARFIALSTSYGEFEDKNLPISDILDPFWHAHVLNTQSYVNFSNKVCSYYIHHYPASSKKHEDALTYDYLANTLPLYEKHFGSRNEKYWGANLKSECGCCE